MKNNEKNSNIFVFDITKDKILPYGVTQGDGRYKNMCLNSTQKHYCTNWVLTFENMDYLHCNDLNWDTKTKCD